MPAPMPAKIILIHGAWAGPWVWDALCPELEAFGHAPVALALPGDGTHPTPPEAVEVEDFFTALDEAIGEGPAVLVGHSGGGMLVQAAACRWPERVSHGVWIAGMLLKPGQSFDDIQETIAGPGGRIGVTPHIQASPGGTTSTVPTCASIHHFFQDLPEDVAEGAAARLTPQPSAGYRIPVTGGPAFDALPKLYIHANMDNSVLPDAQRLMCAGQSNLMVIDMDTGHAPQVGAPGELARHIHRWLNA